MIKEEFRQKFISHRKQPSATCRDFTFDFGNYFKDWIKGFKISDFFKLKELTQTHQMKRKLLIEIQQHFMDNLL